MTVTSSLSCVVPHLHPKRSRIKLSRDWFSVVTVTWSDLSYSFTGFTDVLSCMQTTEQAWKHASTRAYTQAHARTHTCTRTCTHARTCTRTRTRTRTYIDMHHKRTIISFVSDGFFFWNSTKINGHLSSFRVTINLMFEHSLTFLGQKEPAQTLIISRISHTIYFWSITWITLPWHSAPVVLLFIERFQASTARHLHFYHNCR